MATTKTISVWKALNERKILRNRLSEVSVRKKFVDSSTESEAYIEGVEKSTYESKLKANFESTHQLFANLAAYDAAIAEFNASHNVTIGGKEYNVSAAIARHQRLPYEKKFLESIKSQLITTVNEINKKNTILLDESRINDEVKKMIDDRKISVDDMQNCIKSLREEYIKNTRRTLLDPSDLYNRLDGMIEELDEFEKEYNEAFNRLNVTSMITVDLEDV